MLLTDRIRFYPLSRADSQVRGKSAKEKRAAKKYADQDDEDRALALQLLGSAGKSKKELAKEAAAAARAAEEEAARARREKAMERAARPGSAPPGAQVRTGRTVTPAQRQKIPAVCMRFLFS